MAPVYPPQGFDEGTQTALSQEQLDAIKPWANDSKLALEDLLDMAAHSGSLEDQKDILVRGIQKTVLESAPRKTELLLRYTLNRALKVAHELEGNSKVDTQVRVLRAAMMMALSYYNSDLEFLNGQVLHKEVDLKILPYGSYAIEFSRLLMSLDSSVFNAAAQYRIAIMALGLFQWDLYRDTRRFEYAPAITRVNALLQTMPTQPSKSDSELLDDLRKLKLVYARALQIAQDVRK